MTLKKYSHGEIVQIYKEGESPLNKFEQEKNENTDKKVLDVDDHDNDQNLKKDLEKDKDLN